jgi:hypothetical protein
MKSRRVAMQWMIFVGAAGVIGSCGNRSSQTLPYTAPVEEASVQAAPVASQPPYITNGGDDTVIGDPLMDDAPFGEEESLSNLEPETTWSPDTTVVVRATPAPTAAPVVTSIPEFAVGTGTWRQVIDPITDGVEGQPYMVHLERKSSAGGWVRVAIETPPKVGGMQTSIPIQLGDELFAFVSYDDGTRAEIYLVKSVDQGITWNRHGTIESGGADKWPNAVGQHAIICKDWIVDIDSQGSMVSHDGGVTWTDNGGYIEYGEGGYIDGHEILLACDDPRITKTTLPSVFGVAKKPAAK